jgi:HK97 family phage major capsid protein
MSDELDMKTVTKAVEDVNKAWEAEKSARDEIAAQVKKLGAAMPETEAKLAKIAEDLNKAQRVADEAVLAAKRASNVVRNERGDIVDMEALMAQKSAAFDRQVKSFGLTAPNADGEALDAYKASEQAYWRKGLDVMSDAERKALSVGGDANGGFVVNPDMSGRVVQKVFETSPLRAYAAVQVISTDALEGLFDLNEAGFGWVEETGARSETSTPDLGKYRIPVHEMFAKPMATQKLLDDAELNMEAWLAGKVADRFARAENAAFVNGDGVSKPRGFLTYAAGSTLPGQIEQRNSGANGALAAAPAAADVLMSALYDLKAPYKGNATWAMSRATTKLVRQAKDSDGAYLWSPSIAAGQPATLLAYPVASFEDMPDPATGSLSIAVADWSQAYQIVDRIGIRTLRDPYSSKPYIEFYSTKRVGGDVVNFEAIKLVKLAA